MSLGMKPLIHERPGKFPFARANLIYLYALQPQKVHYFDNFGNSRHLSNHFIGKKTGFTPRTCYFEIRELVCRKYKNGLGRNNALTKPNKTTSSTCCYFFFSHCSTHNCTHTESLPFNTVKVTTKLKGYCSGPRHFLSYDGKRKEKIKSGTHFPTTTKRTEMRKNNKKGEIQRCLKIVAQLAVWSQKCCSEFIFWQF